MLVWVGLSTDPVTNQPVQHLNVGERRCVSIRARGRKNPRKNERIHLCVRRVLCARPYHFSKFIEDAVRRRVFHRTVQDIKSRNTDKDPELLQQIIDETVKELRAEKRLKQQTD